MFEITVSSETLGGLADALAEAHTALAGSAAPPKTTARQRPPKDEPEPEERPARSRAKPKDEPVPESADEDIYQDEVRPAINGLAEKYGRETVLDVLSDFDNPADNKPCTTAKQVDPSDYKALLKAIKAKIKELGPVDE